MTKEQLWQAALGELELLISKANFTTWFKNTFIAEINDRRIIVGVPNGFTKAWLETKYHPSILKALQNTASAEVAGVEYRVESRREAGRAETTGAAPVESRAATTPQRSSERGGLDERYAFSYFVVGKGNELARAAARAVADKPGGVYNPLFIYGGVGLGKTHLMQAIGNEILARDKSKRVVYVSSEKFTNEFIQAVSKGNAEKFKNFYRGVDALLIDDIQFLSGKEGTQEEFFHTFNALHQDGKQIVVTSDRPPKSIPALEARLVSRFEWGMVADIVPPDLETRIAILEAKCREKKYELSDDIVHYIAEIVQSNVRELEGALNRIIAYHGLNKTPPTLESTKSLLGSLAQVPKRGGVTPKQVVSAAADYFDVQIGDLLGASRKKELVVPRQIAMFLLREETACYILPLVLWVTYGETAGKR
ncbi:MAG: chromosomal replication initiator protein DnaA [Candidatus Kerfeldbacteria bacterium]|nr:chromosomal replication initiator protein DnaA [Candidatus Kerfeldbacteria bacterium]